MSSLPFPRPRASGAVGCLAFALALLAPPSVMTAQPSSPAAVPADAQAVYARAAASVVVVETATPQGRRQGSGVVYLNAASMPERAGQPAQAERSFIVTNAHVLANHTAINVRQAGRSWKAVLEHVDPELDLAFLVVQGARLPVLTRREKLPEVGEAAFAVGSPSGLENSLTTGIVSGLRLRNGVRYVQTTAALAPGSSGGALLDSAGRLVGITTLKLRSSDALNFALDAAYIDEILEARVAALLLKPYLDARAEGLFARERLRLVRWLHRTKGANGERLATVAKQVLAPARAGQDVPEAVKARADELGAQLAEQFQKDVAAAGQAPSAGAPAVQAGPPAGLPPAPSPVPGGPLEPGAGPSPMPSPGVQPLLRLVCDLPATGGRPAFLMDVEVNLRASTVNGRPAAITDDAFAWTAPGGDRLRISRYTGQVQVLQSADSATTQAGEVKASGPCRPAATRQF